MQPLFGWPVPVPWGGIGCQGWGGGSNPEKWAIHLKALCRGEDHKTDSEGFQSFMFNVTKKHKYKLHVLKGSSGIFFFYILTFILHIKYT